jgi:hypothetical protein
MLTTGKGARGSPALKVTSQYKGVSWNSACSKWVAVLWDRELKRARHIGSFESEEAAARAYDREAIRMLGADAGLNFRESESLGWRVCVCVCVCVHEVCWPSAPTTPRSRHRYPCSSFYCHSSTGVVLIFDPTHSIMPFLPCPHHPCQAWTSTCG